MVIFLRLAVYILLGFVTQVEKTKARKKNNHDYKQIDNHTGRQVTIQIIKQVGRQADNVDSRTEK